MIKELFFSTEFWSAVSAICSCLTVIIMCKQFEKGKRIDVIPILNAWAEEEREEGNLPDVIMDFDEDGKQESIFASWNLVVQNVGVGIAENIKIKYKDKYRNHTVIAYYDMILPHKSLSYMMDINITENIYEFDLDIYFTDMYQNNYLQRMKGNYKVCGDNVITHLYKVCSSKRVLRCSVPKNGYMMRHEEESVARYIVSDRMEKELKP